MAKSSSNMAGSLALVLSVVLVGGAVIFALKQVGAFTVGDLIPDFSSGSSSAQHIRLIPEGQQEFIDHVNAGLSAASITVGGEQYPLDAAQAAKLIKETFYMEVDTSVGVYAADIPEEVIALKSGALLCALDFTASKNQTIFDILIYEGAQNKTLAAIKRRKINREFTYDGQYDALTLIGAVEAITGKKCG